MVRMKSCISQLIILFGFVLSLGWASDSLAESSIYENRGTLTSQSGESFSLKKYRNQTLLVVLGYSSCPSLCPMITEQLKLLDQWFERNKVGPEKLQILFLSVDPDDKAIDLSNYASRHKLNLRRWTLAQTTSELKERLVAQCGLTFNKEKTNDHLRHSFSLAVVSANGKVAKSYPSAISLNVDEVGAEIMAIMK